MTDDRPNVVAIAPVERPVDNGVVELLERMLAAARRGDITAIAGVTIEVKRAFGTFKSDSAVAEPLRVLSYLNVLRLELERLIEL